MPDGQEPVRSGPEETYVNERPIANSEDSRGSAGLWTAPDWPRPLSAAKGRAEAVFGDRPDWSWESGEGLRLFDRSSRKRWEKSRASESAYNSGPLPSILFHSKPIAILN